MNIELRNISKMYNNRWILNNLNASFEANKITFIMGNSGCGKTTLLNIIMGTIKPDSGKILGLEDKKISSVFQEDRLCEEFNPVQNIRLVCNKTIGDTKIKNDLEYVGLANHLNKQVNKLSGGMKRRVSIVRAIIYEANLIIMDEPFTGLDATTKIKIGNYIKSNINNKTVLIVTHNKQDLSLFKSYNLFYMS